jgi:hypothetical protein
MNVIVKETTPDNQKNIGNIGQVYFYFDGKEWVKKWETKLLACETSISSYFQEIEPVRLQVLAGQISPLSYHIQRNLFNVKLLSSYTGISKRHIKKHLKPDNFNRLDEDILKKYASALGISVEELKKV